MGLAEPARDRLLAEFAVGEVWGLADALPKS
jgi:hypothetical protein